LAYYSIDEGKWIIEDLIYYVFVGPSSEDQKLLKSSFTIE